MSLWEVVNPNYKTKSQRAWYHARGACLRPLSALTNLQIWWGLAGSKKPGGYFI